MTAVISHFRYQLKAMALLPYHSIISRVRRLKIMMLLLRTSIHHMWQLRMLRLLRTNAHQLHQLPATVLPRRNIKQRCQLLLLCTNTMKPHQLFLLYTNIPQLQQLKTHRCLCANVPQINQLQGMVFLYTNFHRAH